MLHDFEKILHYSYNLTQQKRKEQERLETRKFNFQNDLMDRTITTEVRWCLQGKSECESGHDEKR
jgi:hypothetical protein